MLSDRPPTLTTGATGTPVRALRLSRAAGCRLCWQRLLGLLDDRGKGARLVHGEVSHNLAVQLDAGQLGTVDELRIGQAFFAHGGVDALDPQGAEVALLDLAIAVSLLAGLIDRLLGNADGVLAATAIALGRVENPLVLLVRGYAALDTGHALVLPQFSP